MLKLKENQEIIPVANESDIEANNIETESFKNGFKMTINDITQQAWSLVNNINSIITTINMDSKIDIDDKILEILNNIVDDVTVDIGMLYKITEMLDDKTSELIEVGEDKAENILEDSTEEVEAESEIE